MKKYFLICCILTLYSCDSIKDVPAPKIYVANIPIKTVQSLSSYFPEAKNFVSKEITSGKLWEIKMETNGKNIRVLTDQDGDLLKVEELYGANLALPNATISYVKEKKPGAAIKSVSKLYNVDLPIGFELTLIDKNENLKMVFDLNGSPISDAINLNEQQIVKIIYSDNSLYLADNEIDTNIKPFISSFKQSKFNLKILYYKSGEKLIELLEKNDPNRLNDRIEYLLDSQNKLIKKFEYLSPDQLNYTVISNLSGFTINKTEQALLDQYQFNYGVQTEKFGLQNSTDLSFTGQKGDKYFVKFGSKNSLPKITTIKSISTLEVPASINIYVKNNFKNANIIACRTISIETDNIDEKNSKIDKYQVEINIEGTKRTILFDVNFLITNFY